MLYAEGVVAELWVLVAVAVPMEVDLPEDQVVQWFYEVEEGSAAVPRHTCATDQR